MHAESAEATKFYLHLVPEFEPSPTDDLHLVLLLKDIRPVQLIGALTEQVPASRRLPRFATCPHGRTFTGTPYCRRVTKRPFGVESNGLHTAMEEVHDEPSGVGEICALGHSSHSAEMGAAKSRSPKGRTSLPA